MITVQGKVTKAPIGYMNQTFDIIIAKLMAHLQVQIAYYQAANKYHFLILDYNNAYQSRITCS